MTLDTVLSAISQHGFPIIACCAIAWFCYKVIQQYRQDVKELTKEHHEEIAEMTKQHKEDYAAVTEAINNNSQMISNNTLMMQRVLDHLERKE